jgi:hypothetical protein
MGPERGSSYVIPTQVAGEYVNVAGSFPAERDFSALDSVNRGIASWSAAQHVDGGLRQKAEMHQVVADVMRQRQRVHDGRLAHRNLTERHHLDLGCIIGHLAPKATDAVAYTDYNRTGGKRQVWTVDLGSVPLLVPNGRRGVTAAYAPDRYCL